MPIIENLFGDDIPKYAILSHTWGTEEVSFKDLMTGTGKNKAGYHKIQFCGTQADRDGLKYFWVDTCCIDKSDGTEVQEAINSMFRWYRDGAKCYVYLSDVSIFDTHSQFSRPPWELAFRKSRWFTRGWTLQELIAPTVVEFFSMEGDILGNKQSLERHIQEITGIPAKALRGSPLSDFTVSERMSWFGRRKTTRPEDEAYSLLGIFEIHMPLLYGEGRDNSIRIQREEFSVPFSLSNVSETTHFVAREKELAEIHEKLRGDGSRHTVVLHGLGGMGKTQLAIAYAKKHRDDYSAIFWLNTRDENFLKQSFAKVAKLILREHPKARWLSGVDMEDFDAVVDAVKAWLSLLNNTRWLIIYDNYDNAKLPGIIDSTTIDICKFLPESYQGSVIITTRLARVDIGHLIRIEKLKNIHDSLEILSNSSKRKGLKNDPGAVQLAKELDGFPLALATAGAYLAQVAISISHYLHLYKASWFKLQKSIPPLASYEDRTLYSTWQLSYDHIKKRNQLSAKLLQFWAYLSNEDIWFELFQHSDEEDPEWIRELGQDEFSFHETVQVLNDHGLIEMNTSSQERDESAGYSIHGCVHSWSIHVLNLEWDYDLAKLALKLVALHVQGQDSINWWLMQRRLLQHATRCLNGMKDWNIKDDGLEWALHNLGDLYADQGKLDEAEKMYQRALQGRERSLGPDHASTLNTVNNLGLVYADQGKLDEAEKMYQRALQGRKRTLGPDHASTLNTVNNLGRLYKMQNKLDEAEKMHQRALQGKENAFGLGPDHIFTLDTVNDLGSLYAGQGKLDEAENMYQRALHGFEKTLGLDHTSTLDTVNNLGLLYADQDKLDEAEAMYLRALQGYEKRLNVTNYRPALHTVWNLGNLFVAQERIEEAREMYARAYSGFESLLGTSILHLWIKPFQKPVHRGTAKREGFRHETSDKQIYMTRC
ncbi:hypothetical protein F5884DRAFT_816866 [Xylogone sp. PMI_703]|nr:hypothetical protein F5884DRAFT_816866 [Xylogone sp. PMI_703]